MSVTIAAFHLTRFVLLSLGTVHASAIQVAPLQHIEREVLREQIIDQHRVTDVTTVHVGERKFRLVWSRYKDSDPNNRLQTNRTVSTRLVELLQPGVKGALLLEGELTQFTWRRYRCLPGLRTWVYFAEVGGERREFFVINDEETDRRLLYVDITEGRLEIPSHEDQVALEAAQEADWAQVQWREDGVPPEESP